VPDPILSVRDLHISYKLGRMELAAVRGVSFDLAPGEVVALVGESGSGKTTVAHSIIGVSADNARVAGGSILFRDRDITTLPTRELESIRGREIGFVPQDPGVALDPVLRIRPQVREVLDIHDRGNPAQRDQAVLDLLRQAGLPSPEIQSRQHPHELSGGLKQRVLIAMALACNPPLVIADEPTSALDVTVQRQILDHIDALIAAHHTALLLVTHDLAVAAERAERILVMRHGQIVEEGRTEDILSDPKQAYTKRLIASAPGLTAGAGSRPSDPPPAHVEAGKELVSLVGISKHFLRPTPTGRLERFTAVDDVSLEVRRGETLGLVGESGSGKSTLARILLRLEHPSAGKVIFDGEDVTTVRGRALRGLRQRVQLVYQNPFTSLNPKLSVGDIVEEPLRAFRLGSKVERQQRVGVLLDDVALPSSLLSRRPTELSGGQRQRVAIARALAIEPEFVVCDEAVSALDVTVQAQILSLLNRLQEQLGLSFLFITHDLAVVREISDRVAVMHEGQLVEVGPTAQVLTNPATRYASQLVEAIPGRRRRTAATD
jgi:peptide/nickel transport system ATP-binding protein